MKLAEKFNHDFKNGDFKLFDSNGNKIYFEKPYGYWSKSEYDSNGNEIYFEISDGYWSKSEYDSDGNKIYCENSTGYWTKYEYDSNGNRTYYETSKGEIIDKRPTSPCNGKIVEIDGKKYQLKEI